MGLVPRIRFGAARCMRGGAAHAVLLPLARKRAAGLGACRRHGGPRSSEAANPRAPSTRGAPAQPAHPPTCCPPDPHAHQAVFLCMYVWAGLAPRSYLRHRTPLMCLARLNCFVLPVVSTREAFDALVRSPSQLPLLGWSLTAFMLFLVSRGGRAGCGPLPCAAACRSLPDARRLTGPAPDAPRPPACRPPAPGCSSTRRLGPGSRWAPTWPTRPPTGPSSACARAATCARRRRAAGGGSRVRTAAPCARVAGREANQRRQPASLAHLKLK